MIKYRDYRHKAIDHFRSLCGKNPDYQTIVGSICNKYYNEYLTSFLDLWVYQNYTEALKELPDGIYSQFYQNLARNYLSSCDSNAILFTFGDNDTYPLLYMQAKEYLRQDVLVINLSLLNNNNYINHLRSEDLMKSKSVEMILSPETYAGDRVAYAAINDGYWSDGYASLIRALELIEENDAKVIPPDGMNYRYLLSGDLSIKTRSGELKIHLQNNYIMKGDLVAMDIIQSNIDQRPIYCVYSKNLGLQNHFVLEGFVYKIVDTTADFLEYRFTGGVNISKTYDFVMNDFLFQNKQNFNPEAYEVALNKYQTVFIQLAVALAENGRQDSCGNVIDRYLKHFPNAIITMDYFMLPMVKAAFKADAEEEGLQIAKKIIANINEEINAVDATEDDLQKAYFTAFELDKVIPEKFASIKKQLKYILGGM